MFSVLLFYVDLYHEAKRRYRDSFVKVGGCIIVQGLHGAYEGGGFFWDKLVTRGVTACFYCKVKCDMFYFYFSLQMDSGFHFVLIRGRAIGVTMFAIFVVGHGALRDATARGRVITSLDCKF